MTDPSFPSNIRSKISDLDSGAVLRASLKALGWKEQFPAYQDQDGKVLVGHRRIRLANQLGIEPIIKTVRCRDDAERYAIAVAANVGFEPMTKEDRKKIAQQMYTDGTNLTQAEIAKVLDVDRATISRDLEGFVQLH